MTAIRWRRAMEVAAVLFVLALLLYAGWRGTWLPLHMALMVLALRGAGRHAPLLLLALWLWPGHDD